MVEPVDHIYCQDFLEYVKMFEKVTNELNQAIEMLTQFEIELTVRISKYDIKETLSFDNKVIKLMSIDPKNIQLCKDFMSQRGLAKMLKNQREAIEHRVNAEKKILSISPQ